MVETKRKIIQFVPGLISLPHCQSLCPPDLRGTGTEWEGVVLQDRLCWGLGQLLHPPWCCTAFLIILPRWSVAFCPLLNTLCLRHHQRGHPQLLQPQGQQWDVGNPVVNETFFILPFFKTKLPLLFPLWLYPGRCLWHSWLLLPVLFLGTRASSTLAAAGQTVAQGVVQPVLTFFIHKLLN